MNAHTHCICMCQMCWPRYQRWRAHAKDGRETLGIVWICMCIHMRTPTTVFFCRATRRWNVVGAPRWSWQHDVNRPCVIFERGLDGGGVVRRNCEMAQTARARRYRMEEQRGKLRIKWTSEICRKDSLDYILSSMESIFIVGSKLYAIALL